MIRPLKKIEAGRYLSYDYKWEFCRYDSQCNWNAYYKSSTHPFFFESYPTLKSLIKKIEQNVENN